MSTKPITSFDTNNSFPKALNMQTQTEELVFGKMSTSPSGADTYHDTTVLQNVANDGQSTLPDVAQYHTNILDDLPRDGSMAPLITQEKQLPISQTAARSERQAVSNSIDMSKSQQSNPFCAHNNSSSRPSEGSKTCTGDPQRPMSAGFSTIASETNIDGNLPCGTNDFEIDIVVSSNTTQSQPQSRNTSYSCSRTERKPPIKAQSHGKVASFTASVNSQIALEKEQSASSQLSRRDIQEIYDFYKAAFDKHEVARPESLRLHAQATNSSVASSSGSHAGYPELPYGPNSILVLKGFAPFRRDYLISLLTTLERVLEIDEPAGEGHGQVSDFLSKEFRPTTAVIEERNASARLPASSSSISSSDIKSLVPATQSDLASSKIKMPVFTNKKCTPDMNNPPYAQLLHSDLSAVSSADRTVPAITSNLADHMHIDALRLDNRKNDNTLLQSCKLAEDTSLPTIHTNAQAKFSASLMPTQQHQQQFMSYKAPPTQAKASSPLDGSLDGLYTNIITVTSTTINRVYGANNTSLSISIMF